MSITIEFDVLDADSVNAMLAGEGLAEFADGWYWAIVYRGLVMLPLDGPYPTAAIGEAAARFHIAAGIRRAKPDFRIGVGKVEARFVAETSNVVLALAERPSDDRDTYENSQDDRGEPS